MIFAASIIIALVGALPFLFLRSAKWKIVSFVSGAVVYVPVAFYFIYTGLPSTAYPLFGAFSVFAVLFGSVSSGLCYLVEKRFSFGFLIPACIFGGIFLVGASGCEMLRASSYGKLIGDIDTRSAQNWNVDILPLDPQHIRLVPRELAVSIARTAIASGDGASLGSQYDLSVRHITLQKIKDQYWYLVPLDYKSFNIWSINDSVPGYVKVNAVDPYAKPVLVTGKKMRYTPGAFFWDFIERKLWSKYRNKILLDYSFEEDDSGNVFWVVTVAKPSIAYWGPVVEGVIVFNPETGEDRFLKTTETDPWIDRVMPESLVSDYISLWGRLRGGWWNSFWTHLGLLEPETPSMNYAADGKCIFVTPVTSNNANDQAMTGLMYTDARTGKTIYYTTNGGATEYAVIEAVNNAVSYKRWHASEQMVYENVYNQLTAVVPILGENGTFQSLALVETQNKRVAVGLTPQDAVTEYQKILLSSGGSVTMEAGRSVRELSSSVARIGWDVTPSGKQYYLYMAGSDKAYLVSGSAQAELALTKEGDRVRITYFDSAEFTVPTVSFENLSLNAKKMIKK